MKLAQTDNNHLLTLEAVVEKNIETVQEWCEALLEIKEKKLYRIAYRTWEEYCDLRWGINPKWVNVKLKAQQVRQRLNIQPKTGRIGPISDSAAATLAGVESDRQDEVIEAVVESGGKPTAKAISDEAEKRGALKPKRATKADVEAATKERRKAKKSGKETITPGIRKEAHAAYGKLVRMLDRMGVHAEAEPHLEALLQIIKEAK